MSGFEAVILEIEKLELGLDSVENAISGSQILSRLELQIQRVPLQIEFTQTHGFSQCASVDKLETIGGQVKPSQIKMEP